MVQEEYVMLEGEFSAPGIVTGDMAHLSEEIPEASGPVNTRHDEEPAFTEWIKEKEHDIPEQENAENNSGLFGPVVSAMPRRPLLTQEEVAGLYVKIRGKDPVEAKNARDEMVLRNLRLVASIAKRFVSFMPFDDLFNEGIIGLMKAVDKYDPGLGNQFSTYATYWIYQTIERSISNTASMIRIPVQKGEQFRKYQQEEQKLSQELGRDPSEEELAERIGAPPDTIHEYVTSRGIRNVLYYNQTVAQTDGTAEPTELIDFIPSDRDEFSPAEAIENKELVRTMDEVLKSFPDREKCIIEKRFGLHGQRTETLEEIGRQEKITRERVRQIENKVLRKIRHTYGDMLQKYI